jgi:hypothetical protein
MRGNTSIELAWSIEMAGSKDTGTYGRESCMSSETQMAALEELRWATVPWELALLVRN